VSRRAVLLALFAVGCSPAPEQPPAPPPLVTYDDAPVRARPIHDAIRDGVAFLLKTQRPKGYWGTGCFHAGWDHVEMDPGSPEAFKVATTGLCCMALRELATPETLAAARRGEDWLASDGGRLRRQHDWEIYNVWGHAYALHALALAVQGETDSARREKLRLGVQAQIDLLDRYQTAYGGWNYYDFVVGARTPSMSPTSFGTATSLVALLEAKNAGLDVGEALVQRAVRVVERSRIPNGAYTYDFDPLGINSYHNKPQGSLGRSQACNEALLGWGSPKVTLEKARSFYDEFVRNHRFIECGRKRQWPHEAWYATAPYYYYFGHYYAARLIERFPQPARAEMAEALLPFVLPHQEEDGSWWDYAMRDFHKPYGTAFALLILRRCRDAMETR
jgi:hypothetical protein